MKKIVNDVRNTDFLIDFVNKNVNLVLRHEDDSCLGQTTEELVPCGLDLELDLKSTRQTHSPDS